MKKAIYKRLIEPGLFSNISKAGGFSEAQLAELCAIITDIRSITPAPPGPPKPPEPPGVQRAFDNNDGINRFNSDDVDYFDSFYESKFVNIASIIEHSDKSIFFRDIYIFINRVKDVTRVKGDILLRQNLQIYLRGIVLAWFITELTDNDKRLIIYNMNEWYHLLLTRWKSSRS